MMKNGIFCFFVVIAFCLIGGHALGADVKRFELIMKDGQLRSHPVRVYVPEAEISRDMNPKLCLAKLSEEHIGKIGETGCPGTTHEPIEIAGNQLYIHYVDGKAVPKSATLLIFDLRKFRIHPFLTGSRVLPILSWKPSSAEQGIKEKPEELKRHTIIGKREVYISNRTGTAIWTFVTLIVFFFIAYKLTEKDREGLLGFVTIKTGISMSLTQMALWTIAVGGVVFAIGLMRLEVPEIPESLVLLMVGAAGTAGFGHWQYYRWQRSKDKATQSKPDNHTPQKEEEEGEGTTNKTDILKTIFNVEVDGKQRPSLAKGQIFFWTVITLILFIVKSLLEGKLWDVPEQLVLLMGVSQASFLARNELAVRVEGKKAENLETENKLVKKAENAAKRAERSAKSAEALLKKAEKTFSNAEQLNDKNAKQ